MEVTAVWIKSYDSEDVLSNSYETLRIALNVEEEIVNLDIVTLISD